MQPQTEVCEDFPLQASFSVRDMLGFEVCHFSPEDGPYSKILTTNASEENEENDGAQLTS